MILSLFIYTVIMSYTPGPNNLLALDATTKFGFKKSMPLLIGIGGGFLLIAFISLVLSDYLQNIFHQFEFLIKIIGSIYLIYLALCTLKSHKNKKDEHNLTF